MESLEDRIKQAIEELGPATVRAITDHIEDDSVADEDVQDALSQLESAGTVSVDPKGCWWLEA